MSRGLNKGRFPIGKYQRQLKELNCTNIEAVIERKKNEEKWLSENILPALKQEEGDHAKKLNLLKKEVEVALNTLDVIKKVIV